MSPGSVLVSYLHPNVVSHSFMQSLLHTIEHDRARPERHILGTLDIRCGAGGLVHSRNTMMGAFLDDTAADWLWIIDSDMGFFPATLDRLLAAADPATRPVVGALCFGLEETGSDGMGGWHTEVFPTLYDWRTDPQGVEGFVRLVDYPADELVTVDGTGAACLLVHRDAAAKVRAGHGDAWFDPIRYDNGEPVSEDLSFCRRLMQAGIPLHVHTGVRTTHHKPMWIGA